MENKENINISIDASALYKAVQNAIDEDKIKIDTESRKIEEAFLTRLIVAKIIILLGFYSGSLISIRELKN